jgi:DNA-binding NtrC family response regulator
MSLDPKKIKKVLVVDDDPVHCQAVKSAFSGSSDFIVDEANDGLAGCEKVESEYFDFVLLDYHMPKLNGLEALRRIKRHDPSIIVIILTAFATVSDAVAAMKEGAYNYLSKPIKREDVLNIVEKALTAHKLVQEIALSAPVLKIGGNREFIGTSKGMKKVFELIDKLTQFETNVLIRGESGTGKELVAKAIHFNSSKKDGRFVAINCSSIPENLIESELFGHEKGAFTGADSRKQGKFQYAEGGTIFLDEIGDLPYMMQAKLLRVLQEKSFTPVGANAEIEMRVRIIAATHQNLEALIQSGKFREDLYYRLNVLPIFLPPLRDRIEDIDYLTTHFIDRLNKLHGHKIHTAGKDVFDALKRYNWPGNIRELENVIERAFILEGASDLTCASLPDFLTQGPASLPLRAEQEILDYSAMKERFEKNFLVKALQTFKGKINQTAASANIPKKTLLRKLEKYQINAKDYK